MPLFLLALCVSVRSEPLPDAVQRRSDKGVYASEYAREYEPMSYAAIPLHSPIPVLHILSPVSPPRREPVRPSASAQRPIYALPPTSVDAYRYSQAYRYAQPYAASVNYVMYANEDSDETAPTILYARPNPNGGYTYRRKPNKKRNAPKRPAGEPVVIRVHKYRIIRDR